MTRVFRLGLFVAFTLSILFVGVFLIGRRQSLFQRTYQVRANFKNVAGLAAGADVRLGGIHQGTVTRIELPRQSTGDVVVVLNMHSNTVELVRKDSVAAIQTDGLLGDKYVEVSFGSEASPKVKDGDQINSEPPFDMTDLIKKSDAILNSTKVVAENAEGVTQNLKSVTGKIDEGKGTLGALVQDRQMYDQAAAGVASFRDNMDALKHNFLLRGFFNRRGYMNADELTKYEISRLPAEPRVKEFTYDAKRLFGKPDSSKFKKESDLNEAGKFLEANKFGLAVIEATGPTTGESDKERQLTEARALAVRKYLAEHFQMDDTRIRTIGRGKTLESGVEPNQLRILVYSRPLSASTTQQKAAKPQP